MVTRKSYREILVRLLQLRALFRLSFLNWGRSINL